MKKIKAAIKATVTITDFKTFGTAAQDNGNGVVRFNSNARIFKTLELKRDDLLQITFDADDSSQRKILVLFRDARQKKGDLLALEYDQRLKLFEESAFGKEMAIQIEKVGKIPMMFWYLWDHPKTAAAKRRTTVKKQKYPAIFEEVVKCQDHRTHAGVGNEEAWWETVRSMRWKLPDIRIICVLRSHGPSVLRSAMSSQYRCAAGHLWQQNHPTLNAGQ